MKIIFSLGTFLLLCYQSSAFATSLEVQVSHAQSRWASCQYEVLVRSEQVVCFQNERELLSMSYHQTKSDELLVMLAVNYASLTGIVGGAKGLSLAREAKDRLEPMVQHLMF